MTSAIPPNHRKGLPKTSPVEGLALDPEEVLEDELEELEELEDELLEDELDDELLLDELLLEALS